MADNTAATLSILIDIKSRLDELSKAREGMRAAKVEGESLSGFFRQGLGIGGGMELARRSVEFFRASIGAAIGSSSALAAEIERADKRLGLSASGYQTLAKEARESQTDFQELLQGLNAYRSKLGDALLDPTQGSAFRQIGQDVQTLAALPLEEQTEKVALGLGKIADANVRARIQQELYGRNAAAMTPVLERLRTQGLEPLRKSAKEAGEVLGTDMAEALNRAGTEAEIAQRKLTIALAPFNLQLMQLKTAGANFLAQNAGRIGSGVEAGFAASVAASLDSGLVKAAELIQRTGGWRAAFTSLGKTLAGPIGVGIAVFLGSYIIKEIERAKIDANVRSDSFDERSYRFTSDIIKQSLPAVQSTDEVRTIYNSAVTEYQKLGIERRKAIPFAKTDEDRERIASMEREMTALEHLIPLIKEKGASYLAANQKSHVDFDQIARDQTDLFVIEANHKNYQDSIQHTDQEKRTEEIIFMRNKRELLSEILELTKALPLRTGQTSEDRKKELADYEAQIAALNSGLTDKATPLSDFEIRRRQFDQFSSGRNSEGGKQLSAGEGVASGAMDQIEQIGSLGEQTARATGTVLQGVTSGLQTSIAGLMNGTMTWGQALRNIWVSFGGSMVQAFAQMLAEYVVKKTAMFAVDTAFAAKGLLLSAASAAKSLVMWLPSAIAASISSWGMAAAIGAAAVIALVAANNFADGGPVVGAGGPRDDMINARLSNGEYVIPAHLASAPRNAGIMASLEGQRKKLPGFSGGGLVGFLNPTLLPQLLVTGLLYSPIKKALGFGGSSSSSKAISTSSDQSMSASGADRYQVAGQSSGVAGSSVSAAGTAAAADQTRAQWSTVSDGAGRSMQVVFLDRQDRNTLERLKRDPGFETTVVDLVERNAVKLGLRR